MKKISLTLVSLAALSSLVLVSPQEKTVYADSYRSSRVSEESLELLIKRGDGYRDLIQRNNFSGQYKQKLEVLLKIASKDRTSRRSFYGDISQKLTALYKEIDDYSNTTSYGQNVGTLKVELENLDKQMDYAEGILSRYFSDGLTDSAERNLRDALEEAENVARNNEGEVREKAERLESAIRSYKYYRGY
ncbi:hypothetical protein N1495_07005 [Streptococcus didelphis]|uniref:SbsC C-terminal domain-containing protein n=1 Tax=Streptococcus didelphis TaxID=102886 RepID=A0ABY9LI04_9STRE|nr:hypothetical protein [Streptococcus didelphis]WMB28479.1 hypothetical protein N1496_02575 [Streptococcus didelphis]WMB29155.1 hypothetical protein N1495_07005 [Streptococcus didelphis]